MSQLQEITIDLIDPCDDSRMIDPAYVQAFVDDMVVGDTLGSSPIDVIQRGERYQQIFGQHRLAAYIQASRETIEARVFQPEDFAHEADIKLHQVKENLFQRSLSALDKALAIHEWKKVYEVKFPTHKHGGRRVKATEKDQTDKISVCFSSVAADAIGLTERSIFRALKIAQGINLDFINKVSLHPIATKQNELLALVAYEQDKQAKIIDLILNEENQIETVPLKRF